MNSPAPSSSDIACFIKDFVEQVPAVSHVMVATADGLLLAQSEDLPPERTDQLSAIVSGLWGMAQGGANLLGDVRAARQVIIEMERGILFTMAVSEASNLTVLAENPCDINLIGYEMGRLVTRIGRILTPALRELAT